MLGALPDPAASVLNTSLLLLCCSLWLIEPGSNAILSPQQFSDAVLGIARIGATARKGYEHHSRHAHAGRPARSVWIFAVPSDRRFLSVAIWSFAGGGTRARRTRRAQHTVDKRVPPAALEKAPGRGRIAAILHEDVEHDPVLIHARQR